MDAQTAEILTDDLDETPDDGVHPAPLEEAQEPRDDPAEDAARLMPLLEGLLFAAGAPVTVSRLVEALDGPDRGDVVRGLELLAARFEDDGRGLRIARVAGGYQLRTLAEHGPWVRRLLGGKPPRLSRAMLETVAIIAYRQPCTRPEIESIRGVDVDAVLSTLLERRMVRIIGRKDAPGRPILYGTTKEFLETFSLPDLDALPPLQDFGALAEALEPPAEEAVDGSIDETTVVTGDAGGTDAVPADAGA